MKSAHRASVTAGLDQEKKSRKIRKKISWWYVLWLFIPLLLWWALRDIQFINIWNTLKQLDLWQILVLMGANVIIALLIGSRWWLILQSQGYPIPILRVSAYRLVAFGISYFTPGPQVGGEPAQVYYLHDRHQVPVDSAVASVSLDKILELLANFTFLFFGVYAALHAGLLARFSPAQAFWVMVWPILLLLAYSIALWVGLLPLDWLFGLLPKRSNAVGIVHRIIASAEEQIGQFCRQNPGTVLLASSISILIWVAMIIEYWLAFRFLGVRLNLVETIVALTAARISFLFPLPGGLGLLESSQVLVMQSLGYDPVLGISISLLMRARDIILGLVALAVGLTLSRQRSRVDSAPVREGSFFTKENIP
jgi:uncharacterized protein (TIRG00374 family)